MRFKICKNSEIKFYVYISHSCSIIFCEKITFYFASTKKSNFSTENKTFHKTFFCHFYTDQNNRYFFTKFSACIQNMNMHVRKNFRIFLSFENMFFQNGVDAPMFIYAFSNTNHPFEIKLPCLPGKSTLYLSLKPNT